MTRNVADELGLSVGLKVHEPGFSLGISDDPTFWSAGAEEGELSHCQKMTWAPKPTSLQRRKHHC